MTQSTRRQFVAASAALLAVAGGGLLAGFQAVPGADVAQTGPATGASASTPVAQGTLAPGVSAAPPWPIDWARIDFRPEKIAPNFYTLTGVPGVDPGHP